jgi:hypothetical protein
MTNFERKKKNGGLDALGGHRTRTLAGILVIIGSDSVAIVALASQHRSGGARSSSAFDLQLFKSLPTNSPTGSKRDSRCSKRRVRLLLIIFFDGQLKHHYRKEPLSSPLRVSLIIKTEDSSEKSVGKLRLGQLAK